MTHEEKQTNLRLARRRYAELKTKKARGAFLDQYCAMTEYDRKTAIRQLSAKERPPRKRGRRFQTGMEARALLGKIWKKAGRPCAKLLQPVLGPWIESLRKTGEARDEAVVSEVLGMSARTIDRRLRTMRPRAGGSGRRRSLAEHRRAIPLKKEFWPAEAAHRAGWMEADSVAHCGGSMAGSFNWTVDLTDEATQWTELRVAWTNAAVAVAECLRQCKEAVPFPVRGVNTDNGPEYLNDTLNKCFAEIFPGAMRTRSRPYCKNDNAHVEQKNGHRARRLFGFGRYAVKEATAAMNEVARLQSLFDNLYRPTMKLLSKTRIGHKYRKVFEKDPKTPAQRVLADPTVGEESKARVRALLAQNDPLRLSRRIERAKERLLRILAQVERNAAEASAPSGGPTGGGSALRAAPSGPPPARRAAGAPPRGHAASRTAEPRKPSAAAPASKDTSSSVTPIVAQPRRKRRGFR